MTKYSIMIYIPKQAEYKWYAKSGLKPYAIGWKVQMDALDYGSTSDLSFIYPLLVKLVAF